MSRPHGSTCSRGHRFTGSPPCPTCYPGFRSFRFRAEVWLYPSQTAAWHFVTVPKKTSDVIRKRFEAHARGWGSLRVTATVGKTTFATSIFPDKNLGAYVLPIKASVRKEEHIDAGKTVAVRIDMQTGQWGA